VRKAVLAAVVAAAAVAGVIAAVLISSGTHGGRAAPATASPTPTRPTTYTPAPSTGADRRATTSASTTASTRASGTAPVPTRSVRLPPPPGPRSPRRRTLIVGVVDDALAEHDPRAVQAQVDVAREAGFDAAVVSATWKRGQRQPPGSLVRVLRDVSAAVRHDHMQLLVVVWHGFARGTPRTPAGRADFAAFAGVVVEEVPGIRALVVGNEPNLNTFWMPQFGSGGRDLAAFGYEDLLARSYDAVKAADRGVLVLGGALSPRGGDRPTSLRPTHSPTAFIRDLGAAYRASHRDRPLMDGFAIHPYMQASRVSPRVEHPRNTSITLADYPKLVALLEEAFRGTAQPAGTQLPVYYTEFGVQTTVPPGKRSFYTDESSPQLADSVGFGTQAEYYRQALALAYCQPTVRGIFVFHVFDEPDYTGWQSGLYFADGTPKPSLPPFRRAVAALRVGRLTTCR
jgi:hypothetical protein